MPPNGIVPPLLPLFSGLLPLLFGTPFTLLSGLLPFCPQLLIGPGNIRQTIRRMPRLRFETNHEQWRGNSEHFVSRHRRIVSTGSQRVKSEFKASQFKASLRVMHRTSRSWVGTASSKKPEVPNYLNEMTIQLSRTTRLQRQSLLPRVDIEPSRKSIRIVFTLLRLVGYPGCVIAGLRPASVPIA
jgi:hypothetical protein